MLVERCPLLERLHLHNGLPVARTIFEQGRWPNLKAFSITGMSSNPRSADWYGPVAQAFIDIHPKLESVDIASIVREFPIAYGPLCHLALWSMDAHAQPGSDVITHLEHLSVRSVGFTNFSSSKTLSSLPALRSLVIHERATPWVLRHIEENVWHLEKLHLKSSFKRCMAQQTHLYRQGVSHQCSPLDLICQVYCSDAVGFKA
jgi:hypothetical protein